MHCGFMDSRLRRFPPDRASAVSYGQTVGNATRCPPLAHRSAAAHKLHSAQSNRYKIRESQNQIPGTGLSLFLPGDCPNDRDHRRSSWCSITFLQKGCCNFAMNQLPECTPAVASVSVKKLHEDLRCHSRL